MHQVSKLRKGFIPEGDQKKKEVM